MWPGGSKLTTNVCSKQLVVPDLATVLIVPCSNISVVR